MIHSLAWLMWAGVILTALSTTRNPFYVGLILIWIAIVFRTIRSVSDTPASPISPWRFALVVVLFSTLFNALTVHFGRTVLFRLPGFLPLIGGIITLEASVFGMLNGLALSGIFTAFMVINRALPVQILIRRIPRAFYPLAVVVSIAVTFVPATLRHLQQIREAQAIRGHRIRGLRDWLPLFLPLLVGGLERALGLAEAMTARGFASQAGQVHSPKSRLFIIVGLLAILSGWLLRFGWGQDQVGLGLLLLGAGLILGTLWWLSRRVSHTAYRPEAWQKGDWGVLFGAVAVALFLLPLPGLDRQSIFFYPYPKLISPAFKWEIGLATVGLLAPALLARYRTNNDRF